MCIYIHTCIYIHIYIDIHVSLYVNSIIKYINIDVYI